jgi:hypothetical protein
MRSTTLLFLVLISLSAGYGQDRLYFALAPGYSLYNSENKLRIVGDKSIGWTPAFSLGFETERFWNERLRIEYQYVYPRIYDILTFTVTSSSGPALVDAYTAHLFFSMHDVDLSLVMPICEWAGVSCGPSFALLNRSVEIPRLRGSEGKTLSFEDRLASYCVGVNASLYFSFPGTPEAESVYAFFGLKARYLIAVYFDARGRDLGHYSQESLVGQIQGGLGYSF